MKGIRAVCVIVVLLAVAAAGYAQTGELHGSADLTYQSRYIWRGFDVYEQDDSAIQPSVTLDLYGTGWGLNVTGHRAISSGHEEGERWDYWLFYRNRMFDGEAYATDYMLSYIYYNYPEFSSHSSESPDLQEIHAFMSWPDLLGVEGLVPRYVLVKLWPSNSGSPVGSGSAGTASGFAHILMLDYAMHVGCPITGEDRVLNWHSEYIFNDGVQPAPGRGAVDHDWSNAVFGVTTDFDLGNNVTLTPGAYYQSSWDDSVNTEDEYWATVNLKYTF